MIPILMQGQTTAEKIKAKFKQINDAKIERLKECEEANTTYATYVRIDTVIAKYTWIESFVNMWDSYAKEYIDTIKATYHAELDFLIQHKNYMESITEEQLERRGYKFKYRWLPTSNFADMEYVFVKEPTINGFIEFLRNKLKEN